jgi:CBS domain containing-hemolysin-like protein
MLGCSKVVNEDLLKEIKKKSYSRIPVYYGDADRKLIIGVMLVKSLVGLEYPEGATIEDLISQKLVKMKEPLYVKPEACVESILSLFKKGTVHQAIVTSDPQTMVKEASAVVEYICAKPE